MHAFAPVFVLLINMALVL